MHISYKLLFLILFDISVVKCPVIQVAPNVRASGNVEDGSYGDVIHFECQSQDMQLNGNDEIYCTSEGKWSDLIPTCKGTFSLDVFIETTRNHDANKISFLNPIWILLG